MIEVYSWATPNGHKVHVMLEECGLAYRAIPVNIGAGDQFKPEFLAISPNNKIPAIVDPDGPDGQPISLFESGAIVLGIAERPEAGDSLLPADPAQRSRAITWLFAALNSIEPQVQNLAGIDLFYAGEEWAKLRRPGAEAMVQKRLSELAAALGDKDYLEDHFSIGDLVMTTVLRILRHTDLVDREPKLAAYLARCEARPAFQRALAAQMAVFEAAE